ncbi:hypothetical protein [Ferruginibacter albus]|uniref:hypothetical protein n=1 Tax=Ferruginibacter albus TaxID=2875540 RepID=UPI001CC6C2AA|nr:hypothetical protein [Ferruginibacter albus]UAY50934.1 hypothetical protein K9M53_10070 [Ferruginibacter albus]
MRSLLLIIISCFTVTIAKAQGPTITSASEAVPGDVLFYQQTQVANIATPATGANLTWDYSALVDSGGIEVDSFKAAASTPYTSIYPGSNLALNSGGAYLYFKTTTNDWVSLGSILPGSDTVFYPSTLEEFHFPFAYGSTFSDSTKEIAHVSGGYRDTFETVINQQGTGYGTLKIPGHTYSNVLQQKTITTQRISPLFSNITTSYLFVTPTAHSFLMRIDLSSQNNISKITYVTSNSIIPTSYTFNGSGDWSNAANWSNGAIPTSPVPSGTQVTITPQSGGFCALNVPMIFSSGATLTVTTGAVFKVSGNLIINK